MSVRVRFAPSPTGFLHVGGLRTALYNFLFAKKHDGKFVLRIEDTDRSRFVENAVENLIDSLRKCGLDYDEGPEIDGDFGPYFQSLRLDIYEKYARELIESGKAYYAFDTPGEIEDMREKLKAEKKDPMYDRRSMRNQFTLGEEDTQKLLESGAPHVIRLAVPDDYEIRFFDEVRGDIKVNSSVVDDQILMKSDGFPTYHLANVIDDRLMKITHVIRGEEWLPSTPKHVLLYEAFGWELPKFAHLPLLMNKTGGKLSKRQGSVAVEDFLSAGFFPEALVNFIALLGRNPSGDREIYELSELIENFDLGKINKGGAVFDREKLNSFNAEYLRKIVPTERSAEALAEELKKKELGEFDKNYLINCVELIKERVEFVKDIPDFAPYLFAEPTEYDEEYKSKHWSDDKRPYLEEILNLLESAESFDKDSVHDSIMDYTKEKDIKLKIIIHPLRLALTGKSAGAGMFETMAILGKDACVRRIKEFLRKDSAKEL